MTLREIIGNAVDKGISQNGDAIPWMIVVEALRQIETEMVYDANYQPKLPGSGENIQFWNNERWIEEGWNRAVHKLLYGDETK